MKEYVTWEDVEKYIDNVAERLQGVEVSGIFTFPRGGLVLATLLSYKLHVPILTNPYKNCIIIDDICDTGITMKKYSDLKNEKNYFITTMYIQDSQLKEKADFNCTVDYFENVKYDNWIVFPWERE